MTLLGELRPSEMITTYGPGAITDLPLVSAVVAGLESWPSPRYRRVSEPRLERSLNVARLLLPIGTQPNRGAGQSRDIPARIFPQFLVCPRRDCRLLPRIDAFEWDGRHGYRCLECVRARRVTSFAFPARFVIACEFGHMTDFP